MINETISVDAGPAISALDALAAAADKAEASFAKLKIPDLGAAAGGGFDKLAASAEAAAAKIEASFARIGDAAKGLGDVGAAGAAGLGKLADAQDAAAVSAERLAKASAGVADAQKVQADTAKASADANKVSADSSNVAAEASERQAVATGRVAKSSAEGAAASGGFFSKHKELILGTGLALGYAVDKAMKFNASMTLLQTQAGVSARQMPQLTKGVLELAGQVGQSPGNLAESLYHVESNMSSLGITAPKALHMVKVAAEGASVGHASLVDTTNALTAAVASGIPGVKSYDQAMGVLNATVGAGDMSMQDLADAMGTGALAVVKGYGANIKDAGAALAVFGDNNIRGAQAGTELRMSVQALAVPAASAKKELAGLGLTTGTLAKTMQDHGMLAALEQLNTKFKEHGVTAKNEGQVLTDLFGKKAGVGLAILMEQMGRLESKYPELTKGANEFGKAWDKTLQTPQQKLHNLIEGTQALAITAGNVLMPYANKALGGLDTGMEWLQSHALASKGLALGAGALVVGGIGKGLFSGVESSLAGLGKIGSALHIPGLDKLAGAGKDAGLTASASALDGAAASLEGAAASLKGAAGVSEESGVLGAGGKGAGAAAAGEEEAAAGGAAGFASKIGPAIGAAVSSAALAWVIGHGIGAAMGAPTKQDEQQYKQHMPGWAQAPANFIFGSKAASLYRDLPGGTTAATEKSFENWYHNIFGGGRNAPRPAEPAAVRRKGGDPFYGAPLEGGVNAPKPPPRHAGALPEFWDNTFKGFSQLFSSHGTPAAPQVNSPDFWKAGGPGAGILRPPPAAPRPAPSPVFYGEVPQPGGAASQRIPQLSLGAHPAAASTMQVKVKADTSSLTADIGAAKGKLAALSQVTIKAPKMPAPDMSALDGAKGKAASAGSGITQAIQGAMHPAKMPPPNLSAASGAAGRAQGIGASISAGLAAGIRSGIGAITAAAAAAASAASAAMAGALQVRSPSKVTEKIGKDTVAGLVLGLQGGQAAVTAAANAIGKSIAKASDIQQIDAAAKKLIADVPKGDTGLTKMLEADNKRLDQLANRRSVLEQEITDSEQVAKSAVSGASVMNSLNAVNPAGNEPIASSAIVTGQGYQAASLKQFAQALQKDKSLGLNATALSQIAQAGPDQGLGIAQGIASGGKGAVQQLNAIQKQIQGSAAAIGNVAGPAMYQAGQDAGKGLASGLKSALGSLDKDMEKIAKSMTAAVEKVAKTTKAAAKKAAAGAASDTTAAAASAASGSATAAKATAGAGKDSLAGAAAGLSAAGSALTSAAAALTSAASALKGGSGGSGAAGAGGSGAPHFPVAAGGGAIAHPVSPSGGGYGGGGGYLPSTVGPAVHYHQAPVTVHVAGSVMTERDLLNTLQEAQLQRSNNNWQSGWQLPGHPN